MEAYDTPGAESAADALSPDALACWVALSRVSGIGPVAFRALLNYFEDDVEAAWKAGRGELTRAGIGRHVIEKLLSLRSTFNPQAELERLEKLRINKLKRREYLKR